MSEESEIPANTIPAVKYESRLGPETNRGVIDSAKQTKYYPDSILILAAGIGVSRQVVQQAHRMCSE